VHRQTILNLLEAEAKALEPPDEFQVTQALLGKQPVATGAAAHRRQQPELFAAAERLHRQATGPGEGPSPSWSRAQPRFTIPQRTPLRTACMRLFTLSVCSRRLV
jgi:hypothetical protein